MLLKTLADWPRWLAVIKTKANHNEVWNHIKPTLKDGERRQELEKPSAPVAKDYSATPTAVPAPTTKDLSAEQLKRYKIDYKIYKDKLKK